MGFIYEKKGTIAALALGAPLVTSLMFPVVRFALTGDASGLALGALRLGFRGLLLQQEKTPLQSFMDVQWRAVNQRLENPHLRATLEASSGALLG